ncbi:similar to Saccharomyces cerevisiae YGR056W RSC1 Component of the RSC chromatin remodeling complex [Maudiozyma saulgeensis]|uniref:Similar to Saccharomyces cerevisiae YGR056W RSC1 Component of the RSC chromatin remodeling complex n=1 Tax=Maudiozyma saulgeensis TaxID=1789683 RepID=A0A1X7RAH7_9SACH|nr:similar to Saccharomyces cerevisiae YGR056W RSC1 Component of the RSC chromatin remodeling complex [Kazachstania saulgeensis]
MSNELDLLHERVKIEFKKLLTLKDAITGLELSPVFNTLPQKRDYPDYYVIITNPVSFNTLRKRIPNYTDATEFMNDVARIPWNAKTYNAKDSEIYRYALVLEDYLKNTLLKNLNEFYPDLIYPDLGPLPDEKSENKKPVEETTISNDDQLQKKIHVTYKKPEDESQNVEKEPSEQEEKEQEQEVTTTATVSNYTSMQPMQEEKIIPQTTEEPSSTQNIPIMVESMSPVNTNTNTITEVTTPVTTNVIHNETIENNNANNNNNNASATTTTTSKEVTPISRNLSTTPQRTTLATSSYNNNKIPSAGSKKTHIRRGRPPIIDLPYIQRMKNILKVLKRELDPSGSKKNILSQFEKLPDRNKQADYYTIVSNPVCIDDMWKKIKTRRYKNFNEFQVDFILLLDNFKTYFSTIRDIQGLNTLAALEKTFKMVTDFELTKPDSEYIPEGEFRYPIDEIIMDGKTYCIGDWVFLNNPNDPNKPIVGQIFKLWSTPDGKKWLNACWYFRPEQTVHRADRLFYKNEVMKTGQYRDHPIEDIRGKCFVIHFTRFQRSDPIVTLEGPLFICEFRYNENDKIFNKIRTWKACLPEEIRDIEDQNIPVNGRKFFKYPSPIKHLLPPNATFDDPIPEPRRGLPNAPPLVGAVYIRPKVPRDDLGEYATSDECPRYVIRPGDPQEDGQIDYINGTILTNSSTHGSTIPRRVDSSSSMNIGNNGSPVPSGPHPKYISNADKMRDTMKVDLTKMQEQNLPKVPINKSNVPYISNYQTMNQQGGFGGNNVNTNMVDQMPIHMVPNTNIKGTIGTNQVPYKSNSRLGSRLMINNDSTPILTKQQQKAQTNKSIASLLQILQTKNSVSQIIIDTPNTYTLPSDVPQRDPYVTTIDHGSISRRYTKQDISLRRNLNTTNETLWFRGPGTAITERIINLGDKSLQLPINEVFKVHEDQKVNTEETKSYEVEEMEEIVIKNPIDATQEEVVVSTTPLVNGRKTITLLNNDDSDDVSIVTTKDEQQQLKKPRIDDVTENIEGPFVHGLRASSTFLAYKIRANAGK